MTLGATVVTSGVVDVVFLTTVIALQQVSAQDLCAAVDNIIHRTAMAGQEIPAKLLLIGGSIASEDVRHLRHDLCSGAVRDPPSER
jgi:hypothetical protein